MKLRSACVVLVLLTCGALRAPVARGEGDADAAAVLYTKEFPESNPPYVSILVRDNGQAVYRTAPDDDAPVQFQLSSDSVREIFLLAGKLHLFRETPLESGRKVAKMGKKTLAYEKGAERYEASFNHTELPAALALQQLFERISQTQQHLLRLEYLLRFDRLGITKQLLQMETDLDHERLLEPAQLLPMLEKIRNDRAVVQVAQGRAARIIEKIQFPK